MAQHFTLEDFNAALTQLPEYGGYEALSGALGEQFPDAQFVPNDSGQGINSTNWEPTGNVGQWFPLDAGRIQSTTNPNRLASYEAMYPALTSLINPQRNVAKMGPGDELTDLNAPWKAGSGTASGYVSNDARDADYLQKAIEGAGYYQGENTMNNAFKGTEFNDERGKNNVVGIGGQAATGANATIGGGAVTTNPIVSDLRDRPMEDYRYEVDTSGVGAANQQGGVVLPPALNVSDIANTLPTDIPDVPAIPVNTSTEAAKPEQNFYGDGDEIVSDDITPVTTSDSAPFVAPTGDDVVLANIENDIDKYLAGVEGTDPLTALIQGGLGTTENIPAATTDSVGVAGGTGLPNEPDTNLQATVTASPAPPATPEGTSAVADVIDIDSDNKDLETVNNDIDSYLETKGWSDSGDWGYARTRNMLTGGGLGGVVTEGALVPWQSMGQDASSRDYISNVGDIDRFPSSASSTDIGAIVPNAEGEADVERVHRAGIGFSADAIASYGSDNTFDITGASLFPESTGRTETGGVYFKDAKDLAEWGSGITSATGIKGIQQKFNYKVFDPDGKFLGIGNKLADAAKDLTKFAQDTFAFMGDPSKEKGDDPTPIRESMDALRSEMTQFWHTNPNNLWGRKLFKPGETQDYGSLQPYAIFAALLNPPLALVTLANTVLHDFMYAAKGMFSGNANYDGNPVQDLINGAFHFLGRGIKSVAKNAKKLFGGKAKEGGTEGAEGEALEGEDAFMKQLFKEQKDNKLRILWDEHVMMNTNIAAITKAFSAEGIPVVLYEKGKAFTRAIQQRKRSEAKKIYNEIKNDLGEVSVGSSGDLFNLQSLLRGYSFEDGWQEFLKALEEAHKKSGQA